jgi:hypothetical protein
MYCNLWKIWSDETFDWHRVIVYSRSFCGRPLNRANQFKISGSAAALLQCGLLFCAPGYLFGPGA